MSETLVSIVKQVRDKARNFARMYAINRFLWTKADLEGALSKVGETTKELVTALGVLKYDLAHLDPTHPEYEKDKKSLEEAVKSGEEEVAASTKADEDRKTELTKEIAEVDGKIKGLEDGTVKVTKEHIDEQVDRLISRMD
jgi:hypothetical protein